MKTDTQEVKKRSIHSILSLFGQSSYSAALGFVAFFILTQQAGVYLLGLYATVLATLSFFNYITDLGLGAAIMQKKEVTSHDLNTVFYIQAILTVVAGIVGFLITPLVMHFYKDLPPSAVYLYWSILVSFLILNLKSIPSILLEKNLEIYKVVIVQIVENTIFYALVIVLVMMGYDIMSLVIAVFARAIVGTALMFVMRPWRPRLEFSMKSASELVPYGLQFQGNSFLALVKDDLFTIFLGGAIGLTYFGYVAFAKKYAEFSIRLIMDNINRVAFPLFARYNDDPEMLRKSLNKVISFETLLIFPAVVGALFVFRDLLIALPDKGYFAKWEPALYSFYFFSLSAFFIALSTPFINLFNAIGKVRVSLYFMVFWTCFVWLTIPLAVTVFGYQSVSVLFFVMSLSFVAVYKKAQEYVKFSLWEMTKDSVIATIGMAAYLAIVLAVHIQGYVSSAMYVILAISGGAICYGLFIYLLKGKEFVQELKSFIPSR